MVSKKIIKKRERQKQMKEATARRVSPLAVVSVALLVGGVCLYLVLAPLLAPQNPLTAWDDRWKTLPGSGAPARAINEVKEAYAFAAHHPEVTDHLPCFCGCAARYKHKGLTDCFVKGWTTDRYPIWDSMGFT
jgi:hypothetical protein